MPSKFFPTFNFFLRRIFWNSNYMEHNHNKKIGGLWLRFQDTGQWCVAFLTKNWQFYVIFGISKVWLSIPCWAYLANPLWLSMFGSKKGCCPHLPPPSSLLYFPRCTGSTSKSGILFSHRPGRAFWVLGFGGYRWYPPDLAPPAAFASGSHYWPHSFILLQFQMDLLALSAVSPILLSFLLLSPPPIPMSFSKFAIDDAGKRSNISQPPWPLPQNLTFLPPRPW